MKLATKRVVKSKPKEAVRKVKQVKKRKDRSKENYQTIRRRTKIAKEKNLPLEAHPEIVEQRLPTGIPLTEEDLPLPKKQMIALIKRNLGLVKYVAAACKVARSTIYCWRDTFPWFDEAMKDWKEDLVDLAVHSLDKNIRKGKEYSTTYALNCLGRDRGFINTQVIQHQDVRPFEGMNDEQLDKRTKEESDRLALLAD